MDVPLSHYMVVSYTEYKNSGPLNGMGMGMGMVGWLFGSVELNQVQDLGGCPRESQKQSW